MQNHTMSRVTKAMLRRLDRESLDVLEGWAKTDRGSYGREQLDTFLDETFRYPMRADDWKRLAWIADDTGYGSNLLHWIYANARRGEGTSDRLPKLSERERERLETAMGRDPYQWIEKALYEQIHNANQAQVLEYLIQQAVG